MNARSRGVRYASGVPTETYLEVVDGLEREVRFEVNILVDLVTLCSHCGFSCTGELRLWFELDGIRNVVQIDNTSLSEHFLPLVEAAHDQDSYSELPATIRDWDESEGYADVGFVEGKPISTDELDALATLVRSSQVTRDGSLAFAEALEVFAARAKASGRRTFICAG